MQARQNSAAPQLRYLGSTSVADWHTRVTHHPGRRGWLTHSTTNTNTFQDVYGRGSQTGDLPAVNPLGAARAAPPLPDAVIASFPKKGTTVSKFTATPFQAAETGHLVRESGQMVQAVVHQQSSDGTKRYAGHQRHAVGGSEDLVGTLRPNRKEAKRDPGATQDGAYPGYHMQTRRGEQKGGQVRVLVHPGYHILIKARNGQQARVLRLDTKTEIQLVNGLVEGLQQKGGRNAQLLDDLRSSKGVQVTLKLENGHLKRLDLQPTQGPGLLRGLFSR